MGYEAASARPGLRRTRDRSTHSLWDRNGCALHSADSSGGSIKLRDLAEGVATTAVQPYGRQTAN